MDSELAQRLDRIEAKLDAIERFVGKLESLFSVWMSGGRGRLLLAAAKLHNTSKGQQP